MSYAPSAADITLRQTLDLLDGPFATLATGVAEDSYAFWLGSGISLGRLDGLKKLVPRVLDYLQRRVIAGDPNCRFRAALHEMMNLAGISPPRRASTDLERPIAEWPTLADLVDRLSAEYAKFLDLAPRDEEVDYLLWEAVDVRAVYADPAAGPDSEHLCLALLALEGAVSQMPSANWDPLVERAFEVIAPGQAALVVCVIADDLRQAARQATLYKFHGCALRAKDDPAAYRAKLIARAPQIDSWREQADNRTLLTRLTDIATTKRTLVLGLSVQDGNIKGIFSAAEASMPWQWPTDPPAYAFSEEQLGFDQRTLLQIVYRTGYNPATRDDIYAKALVRAYAKPLLAALALHVIFAKLERLIQLLPSAMPEPERQIVANGLRRLRDAIAEAAQPPSAATVHAAIKQFARFLAFFHEGDATAPTIPYRPITSRAIQHIAVDPFLNTAAMPQLAVALGLTGLGVNRGDWSLEPVDLTSKMDGAFKIVAAGRRSKVFIVANSTAATRLTLNGHLKDDDDAIVVHGLEIAPAMPRSPSSRRARTGAPGVREVSIATLLAESPAADALVQRFSEEVSV